MTSSFRPGDRSDLTFAWAASDDSISPWRSALIEWATQHAGKGNALWAGNSFLDYLQANPTVARTPEEFCRRAYINPHPFPAWVDPTNTTAGHQLNRARAFFIWFLDRHLSVEDDFGRPVPSPAHWNPIAPARIEPHPTETSRQPLPTRLLRDLLHVLTDDDWAWPKSLKADRMMHTNPETGRAESIWCPVRAVALALKLLLPLRTFQVRVLESGEGDTERYDAGTWGPNLWPHAPPLGRVVARGFLRKLSDRGTGTVTTGFFVNTNKTSDRLPGAGEVGYVMPWQHEEAIALVDMLARWQTAFNPVASPLAWSALHDRNVRLSAARGGGAFFLMRDPKGTHPNEPVSHHRLASLWERLLSELEHRLATRGETMADGGPIRLTESKILKLKAKGKKKARRVSRSVSLYDLHSLRVSLITALATEGGLPLHILSKCIAGHASLLMTLYYIKTDPATMAQQMTEATAKIDSASQAQFTRYLRSADRAADGFVSNDPTGAAALDRSKPASWMMVNTGICPVGGTRCSVGGPALGKNKHGPVPGGRHNCVRCRFHITGPAFLPTLVARFNADSMRVNAAKREHDAAEQALELAENRQFDRERGGHAGASMEMAQAQDRRERAEASLNAAVETLQATYILVERCKAVLRRSTEPGLNLVLVGGAADMDTAVRATSDLDLFDSVCQAATLHPCGEVEEASLRRRLKLDQMLMRHGHMPAMLGLSDADALKVGNEMTALLAQQFGREGALRVVEGGDPLESDVAAELDKLLALSATPSRVLLGSTTPTKEDAVP